MLKIQISPRKMVDDALVIWPEQTPDVDLVLDPRPPHGLKMKPGSVKVIYAFGILGLTQFNKIPEMLKSFVSALQVGGELYIIEQDFDYMLRALLGGDLTIREFNDEYHRVSYLNQEEIVVLLEKAGFPDKDQRWWHEGVKFEKKNSEIIISATKNNKQ
jgi:hypothetical protein